MTDLEGVAGVMDFENWCTPESRYYEQAKALLTREVNAAVDGFFAAGATQVVVADGHGHGGINPALLDARAELMRGWPEGYPCGLDEGFDFLAWVGQHAKAGTEYAHLAHTQGFEYLDLLINGVSVGEFGQFVMCASELGIRTIFGSGDLAFTKEAEALIPGIETVAVKRGRTPGTGDECNAEEYANRNTAATHLAPSRARELIRDGAKRALERAQKEDFGLIPLTPPFERVAIFRPTADAPKRISRESHPTSVIELMNLPFNPQPM
jgi:D-amino peptidase